MARTHAHRQDHAEDRMLNGSGWIALAATALAGAALYYLFNTRAGQDTRSRLLEGDVGRRLHDTMEEIQRLAEQGAAYVERRAAEMRHALEARSATE